MRGSIGQVLIAQGVIDAAALSDALARQGARLPVASMLYALGYASERHLCAALAAQNGWPAVVLDESVLRLDVLEHIDFEWARQASALLVAEDEGTLTIAATRPEDAIAPARELAARLGKRVELRIALDVTLARTIRLAFRRWRSGERYLVGVETDPRQLTGARLAEVFPDGGDGAEPHRQAQRALAEDAARGIEDDADLPGDEAFAPGASLTSEWQTPTTTTEAQPVVAFEERTSVLAEDLDRGPAEDAGRPRGGPPRALVCDPDVDAARRLVAELERQGYACQRATAGAEALGWLMAQGFELVFADVATPEHDGLRLCRAIKRSRRLAATRVVVTAAVVDTGQIPEAILTVHGVDGYLEKPLDLRRLQRLLRELGGGERVEADPAVAAALACYRGGDLEGAIARLRGALAQDPASARLRFLLANLLQRVARWPEAIDEYEVVVDLQPTYFPALTRLAYLYFRQGLHARAVETWRRSLPYCEDPALRQNIETFMRKLIADLGRADGPG